MTDEEREVLKMALEDLKRFAPYFKIEETITAIKEALAQPEQEQLMSDQLNYGMSVTQGGKRIDPMSIYKEPEQEPVAEVDDWRDSIFTRYVEYLPSGTRLYTTPLEPKPLTDEEIILIVADCASSHQHTDIHFARAIEAKLKEKNT